MGLCFVDLVSYYIIETTVMHILNFMRQCNLISKSAAYSLNQTVPWTVLPRVSRDESGETDGTICNESEDFSVSEKTWAGLEREKEKWNTCKQTEHDISQIMGFGSILLSLRKIRAAVVYKELMCSSIQLVTLHYSHHCFGGKISKKDIENKE